MAARQRSSTKRRKRRKRPAAPDRSALRDTLTVSLLAPGGDDALTDSVRCALSSARVATRVWSEDEQGEALMLVGGVSCRCFLDVGGEMEGAVRPNVIEAVRQAHAGGRWIAAAGVAVAAALHALEPQVAAGQADRRISQDGIAVFPALRLICFDRPMLGEVDGARGAIAAALVGRLLQATSRAREDA